MSNLWNQLYRVVLVWLFALRAIPCPSPALLCTMRNWGNHISGVLMPSTLGRGPTKGRSWQRGEVKTFLLLCFGWHLLSTSLLHGTIAFQTDLPSVVPAPPGQAHNSSDPLGGPKSHAAPVTPPPSFVPPTLGEGISACTFPSPGCLCWVSQLFRHLWNHFLLTNFLFWGTQSSFCFIGWYNSLLL